MPSIDWVARWPFGSTAVLPSDAESRSDFDFGKLVYDAVEPTWPPGTTRAENVDWVTRSYPSWMFQATPASQQKEDELLDLFESTSSRLFEEARLEKDNPLTDSQLWAEIGIGSENDSGRPQIKLIGDLFRQLLFDDLPSLSEHDFPKLPRVDISAITGYYIKKRCMKDNVIPAFSAVGGSAEASALFLKTIDCPPGYFDWKQKRTLVTLTGKRLFWGELEILSSLPAHPNVIPAPLALVTVRDDAEPTGATDLTRTSSKVKLVGWLQPLGRGFFGDHPFQRMNKNAAANRLRYAYELCCGIHHLIDKGGFYHSEMGVENILFAGTYPNDHLIVIDLQPFTNYHNKNGPEAPEVEGDWNVSQTTHGQLEYACCDGERKDRGNTIYNDWKSMPEALERLTVYNLGSMLSVLLSIRLEFSWASPGDLRRIHFLRTPEVGVDAVRDAWEALFPASVRALVQRCSVFDPRDRPMLREVTNAFEEYKDGGFDAA